MTKDQQTALYIAGGVAAIAALWYFARGTVVQTAPEMVANPSVPGYTDFNMPSATAIPQLPAAVYETGAPGGCGCGSRNDGCFTSSIDSGQAPVSINQLTYQYANADPKGYNDFLRSFLDQLAVYKVTPEDITTRSVHTIGELRAY